MLLTTGWWTGRKAGDFGLGAEVWASYRKGEINVKGLIGAGKNALKIYDNNMASFTYQR